MLSTKKFNKSYDKNATKIQFDVGYSDHTLDSITASSCKAKVIEKHITLSKNQTGPDHLASMEPKFQTIYFQIKC